VWSGVALDGNGAAQACMGAGVGGLDGDGSTDLFVTNFADDASTLYRAMPAVCIETRPAPADCTTPTFGPLSWGTALADLDQDGDLDLVQVNGHIYPQVDEHPELGQRYLQPAQLFENKGDGHICGSVTPKLDRLRQSSAARGLAVGDVDGDGDLDLLVSQLDGPPVLLRNDGTDGALAPGRVRGPRRGDDDRRSRGDPGRWQAPSARSSRAAIPTWSCNDPRMHFGLGAATRVDELRVHWPDRSETVLENVPVFATHHCAQGPVSPAFADRRGTVTRGELGSRGQEASDAVGLGGAAPRNSDLGGTFRGRQFHPSGQDWNQGIRPDGY
jgi:hypothetical protein